MRFSEFSNINENFADGKVKGKSRPGRVKRAGASCGGSVSSLRSKAKKAGGERGKMYHWCANMKSGRNKKSNEEYATGPRGQARGGGPMPKAKPGRTRHPLHGKLVGGS
jgi:hypothetical protein